MSLRHALLGLLANGPASGYDLLKTFDTSLANVWPATQSQIYSELTKLAETGLLDVSAEGPRGRKEYTLTDAGLTELRHWLVEVEPVRATRNDTLLRVFFLGTLTNEQARAYLAGLETHAAKALADLVALEDSIDWTDSDLSVYGHLTLEWGKRFTALQQEWAQWALTQLPQPDQK
jgi:DNA-binding PadR family transcriptional regulator